MKAEGTISKECGANRARASNRRGEVTREVVAVAFAGRDCGRASVSIAKRRCFDVCLCLDVCVHGNARIEPEATIQGRPRNATRRCLFLINALINYS
jgi:hypothetical protein